MDSESIDNYIFSAIESEVAFIKDSIVSVRSETQNENMKHDFDIFNFYIKEFEKNYKTEPSQCLLIVRNLDLQVAVIMNKVNWVANQTFSKVKNTFQKIITSIRNISSHVWQLVSKVMTVKGFSISGDVGANAGTFGFLGLSANLNLQINFGK